MSSSARVRRTEPAALSPHDQGLGEALHLIVGSIADLLGFEIAAVGVVQDDQVVFVTVAADDPATRAEIIGTTVPRAEVEQVLAQGCMTGPLLFLPVAPLSATAWVPTDVPEPTPVDADAGVGVSGDPGIGVGAAAPWHPQDVFVMRLTGSDGELLGILSLDLPRTGLRPTHAEVDEMAVHAAQAGRAIESIIERQRLDAQMAMATAVQRIIRDASGHLSVPDLLGSVEDELVRSFDADMVWVHLFGQGGAPDIVHGAQGLEVDLPEALNRVNHATSERFWELQEANVVAVDDPPPDHLDPVEVDQIKTFLDDRGIYASLFAPLGVGRRCLGNVVVARRRGKSRFNTAERSAAIELGVVLGQAVARTRVNERQRELVEELRKVDAYKTQLIATLAHELKNPLTSVMGYVEVLESLPEPGPGVVEHLETISSSGLRMRRLVGDMLVLSRLADPHQPMRWQAVSLRSSVLGALPHLHEEDGIDRLRTDLPSDPLMVSGDPHDLERLCGLLMVVGLARSGPDEPVVARLARDGDEVVLTCDQGREALTTADRERYFSEFSRPGGLQQGTGLEMAICRHIVARHDGTIRLLDPDPGGVTRVEVRLAGASYDA